MGRINIYPLKTSFPFLEFTQKVIAFINFEGES